MKLRRPNRKQPTEKAGHVPTSAPDEPSDKKKRKRTRRTSNRRLAERAESVMVALDNPNGIRWIMEFAPIYASILQGIELSLSSRNKQMQVCSIRSVEEFESLVRGRPPDGILSLASNNILSLKNSIGSIPCVSVLGHLCDGDFDVVTYNQAATGRLPAELFHKNGISEAAVLGPTEPGRDTTFGTRFSSFCEAMKDGKGVAIPLLSDDLYEPGNPHNQPRSSEIERLVQRLKTMRPRPKGLFVMADNLLPSVYFHLEAAGLTPGVDLQVISCNSESPYLSGLAAQPARVEIPAEEIGYRSVEILEWRTQNPTRRTSTTILSPTMHIPPSCSFIS